ncbi:hypothetical protein [Oceanirhabdus sp. W0125-5]|uniref:hypothetical protein n=1 Tax=Oceanirhabdus sp. W0125-5 TaxID=2999116 RepID=UPI0022F3361C|nr:hypothetical protein [Oceanirhabdus sp. W0125-5]WBW96814.1 hypothetical protein OW730_24460 [Oceanirhabdus sp. W0125-5]
MKKKLEISGGIVGITAVIVTRAVLDAIGFSKTDIKFQVSLFYILPIIIFIYIHFNKRLKRKQRKYFILTALLLLLLSILSTIVIIIKDGFYEYYLMFEVPIIIIIISLFFICGITTVLAVKKE